MCVMVLSSAERFNSILQKLSKTDISHIHFCNVGMEGGLGMPLISLMAFTELLVCEDSVLNSPGFREGWLIYEAERMNVPVLSETGLSEALSG